MHPKPNIGVLLVNVGSPHAPTWRAVWAYLAQFLSDARVLPLPTFWRYLLLYCVILPFRSWRSARLYKSIWTPEGSPLLLHSASLAMAVEQQLGPQYAVRAAMRIQEPSLAVATQQLLQLGVRTVVVLPLFPQYSSATTGSVLQEAARVLTAAQNVPALVTIPAFYAQPKFTQAFVEVIKLQLHSYDYVLFSYHGLPESEILKSDCSKQHCLKDIACCSKLTPANAFCYRSQCLETSKRLAQALALPENIYGSSFQSRFGRSAWLQPYTQEVLISLRQRGINKLAVVCPSFVADCLETLEEIGIRLKKQWLVLGGTSFQLIDSLNTHPSWVAFLASTIQESVHWQEDGYGR